MEENEKIKQLCALALRLSAADHNKITSQETLKAVDCLRRATDRLYKFWQERFLDYVREDG